MRNLFKFALCFLFLDCAPSKPLIRPIIQDTFIIDAPYEKTWRAVASVIAERGLPIESVEKESGLLTTKFVTFARGMESDKEIKKVAVIKTSFLLIWERGRYALSIYCEPVSGSTTRVKITAHIEGFESNVSKSWHVCYSNGNLEKRIAELVQAKGRIK